MRRRTARPRSAAKLVAAYALATLVPVVLLGLLLADSYRSDAQQRGIAEAVSEARLIAQTTIAPRLDGQPLSEGIGAREEASLQMLVRNIVADHQILRLRLRDLAGAVEFSDDGSGFRQRPEDEAIDAGRGVIQARLTRLNSDAVDSGPAGVQAVEVYLPLMAGEPRQRVGVLEVYLPYAPISADVSRGLGTLRAALASGLAALYLVLFLISASVSRRLRRQLRVNTHLAEHDPLTGLPNRAAFHRSAEVAVTSAARGRPVAIAIIDLDRFKEVNDTLGHHSGDQLLRELAARLGEISGRSVSVARLGGDEFGIVLRGAVDIEATLWEVRNLIEQEVSVAGLPLSVDASVGFVVAPEDGTRIDELMQLADVAMYVAKTEHSGVRRYDASQNHYDAANLALIGELRRAIELDELVLHYQPQVRLADGEIEALEALVRWQHPVHGLLGPDRFVPLAEQTDLIDKLTDWVLHRALRDLALLDQDRQEITIAVNVSARNLAQGDFAAKLRRELEICAVPAHRLVIEITETALLVDPERAAAVLQEIAASGVRISLDDFGRGQTSLGYLAALPVSELKIDQSFVTDMSTNVAHAAIVRSIVELGHNLSLRVVGEGVENEDELLLLRAAGCDMVQGYVLSRPMPKDDVLRRLPALGAWQRSAASV